MSVDQLGRAYQAYRRTTGSRSIAVLLVANAIPLVGVLLFGWSLYTILVIYWLENGIVGLWNVPKILLAQGSIVPQLPDAAARAATGSDEEPTRLQEAWVRARAAQVQANNNAMSDTGAAPAFAQVFGAARLPTAGRAALGLFFMVHYGMFWFVHGIFVFTLPMFLGSTAECGESAFGLAQPCTGAFGPILWTNVWIAAAALFISHGASFLFNYIGRAEYLTASPTRQMGAPYGRVLVLHLTILLGAFAVGIVGAPIAALLLLVGLKTALDLGLHRRERRAADARVPADTTFGQIVRDA